MKRYKNIGAALIIAVMLITVIRGGFSAVVSAASRYDSAAFFSGRLIKEVKCGGSFTVPDIVDGDVKVTVRTPDGKIAADNSQGKMGVISAVQPGNYIITYAKGSNSYSYNVFCYEEKEYFVDVMANEDDFIPAYRRSSDSDAGVGSAEDSIVKLPYFRLAYKNERGETVALKNADYGVDFTPGGAEIRNRQGIVGNPAVNEGKKQLENLSKGILIISLRARVNSSTQKWYTREYTVNVQKNFVNENSPIVSVAGVSPNANVNALYTLPVATASDTYADNVFVRVSVIDPDGIPVKHYAANDYGYADLVTEGEEIKFDNKEIRSFYPVKSGSYRATYVAVNGSGMESSPLTYIINADDRLAPVITQIDEAQIPNKWGISEVYKGDGADSPKPVARSTEFTIPFPVCVDNCSGTDNLSLTVSLVNANNRTVGYWTGKISEYAGSGVALSESYRDYFKDGHRTLYFKADGMKFSFDYIDFSNVRLNRDNEKLGDWTLTYSLRDEANMGGSGNARKSYTIAIQQNFSDVNPPVISKNFQADIPEYVTVTESGGTFAIPYVAFSDDNAIRTETEYFVESVIDNADKPSDSKITIDGIEYGLIYNQPVWGGERYNVRKHNGRYYAIRDNNKYAIPLSTNDVSYIRIFFAVTDNAGNKSEESEGLIKFVYAENVNKGCTLTADLQKITQALEADAGYTVGKKLDGKVVAKRLGGFDAGGIKDYEFSGFELSVSDQNGISQVITAYSYFHKEGDMMYSLHVRNIEFTPSAAGEYRLNIRIFDISGRSKAYGFFFEIADANNSAIANVAAKIDSTGSVNVAYKLENEYCTPISKCVDGVTVRCIEGRAYTLVGNEFTALYMGTYRITDFVFEYGDIDNPAKDVFGETYKTEHHQKTYKPISISNDDVPVIEILGIIPAYHPITNQMKNVNEARYTADEYVTLPAITAYTKYGNADIEVRVSSGGTNILTRELFYESDEDGKSIQKLTFEQTTRILGVGAADDTEFINASSGQWAFPALKDGLYTITVTAKMPRSNALIVVKIFEMRIGKANLPAFSVIDKQVTAKVGDKFIMGKPLFDIGEDWISVTIKLLDPAGFEVADSSTKLSITGIVALNNYENWETAYEFEKAGNYTVVITVIDSVGLVAEQRYTVVVTSASGGAQIPDIIKQPVGKTAAKNGNIILSVTAGVADGGTLSYQWYTNTSDSNEGGTLIDGATDATYKPDSSVERTTYYYCAIINTKDDKTASITTNTVKVTVNSVNLCGSGCGSLSSGSSIFDILSICICALFLSVLTVKILSKRTDKGIKNVRT